MEEETETVVQDSVENTSEDLFNALMQEARDLGLVVNQAPPQIEFTESNHVYTLRAEVPVPEDLPVIVDYEADEEDDSEFEEEEEEEYDEEEDDDENERGRENSQYNSSYWLIVKANYCYSGVLFNEDSFRARLKENENKNIWDKDLIYGIAASIYGEDRVELKTLPCDDNRYDIFAIDILFPEFKITNSSNLEHTIRGLIVRIAVSNYDNGSLIIGIGGFRNTLSKKEYISGYSHSHLESYCFDSFTEFCLGSSEIRQLMVDMGSNPTDSNWHLLFYDIERYVQWESIEGGPYIKMQNIKEGRTEHVSNDEIEEELGRIADMMPRNIFTLSPNIQVKDDGLLVNFLNKYSRIRTGIKNSRDSEVDIESAEDELNDFRMKWRGKFVDRSIFIEEEPNKEQLEEELMKVPVSDNVIATYRRLLLNKCLDYSNHLLKEKLKEKHYERVFRKARIV